MSAVTPAQSLARLGRELAWPERAPLGWGLACMVVLGLATGAFAFLTGPLLRHLFTGGGSELIVPLPAGLAPLVWDGDRARHALPFLLLVLGALRGVAYLGQFYAMGWFGQRVAARLRRRLFVRLLGRSPLALTQERTGELLQRWGAEVTVIESAATYAVASYLRDGLQLLVLAGVAWILDWRLTLACAVVLPLVGIPTARVARSVLRHTRLGQTHLGALAAELQEGLRELPMLQAFGGEGAAQARFSRAAIAHRRAVVRAGWKRALVPALTELIAAAALAGVLLWASTQGTPGPALVSFATTLALMYQPAKDLSRFGQLGLQAAVAGERLWPLLEATDAVHDSPSAVPATSFSRELRLENVTFAYPGRQALRAVSLRLEAGQVVGLVGRSGAGKSTIARLLLRAARPQEGSYSMDGVDVEGLTVDSVRAQLALVTQEPLLFSGTIAENLRVGRPGATQPELEEACRDADAHDFIARLPEGYATVLGERGGGLSGGQRQRLCLARALLSRAPLLLLDEATAGLDPESEREVQRALERVLPGRTALVIAHRLAGLQKADRIYVLEEGHVVEEGTHEALLARGEAYARLWRMQNAAPEAGAA